MTSRILLENIDEDEMLQVWLPSKGQTVCLLPPLQRELWSHSVDWVCLQDIIALLTLRISFLAASHNSTTDHHVGDNLLACSDFSCDRLTPGAG